MIDQKAKQIITIHWIGSHDHGIYPSSLFGFKTRLFESWAQECYKANTEAGLFLFSIGLVDMGQLNLIHVSWKQLDSIDGYFGSTMLLQPAGL